MSASVNIIRAIEEKKHSSEILSIITDNSKAFAMTNVTVGPGTRGHMYSILASYQSAGSGVLIHLLSRVRPETAEVHEAYLRNDSYICQYMAMINYDVL